MAEKDLLNFEDEQDDVEDIIVDEDDSDNDYSEPQIDEDTIDQIKEISRNESPGGDVHAAETNTNDNQPGRIREEDPLGRDIVEPNRLADSREMAQRPTTTQQSATAAETAAQVGETSIGTGEAAAQSGASRAAKGAAQIGQKGVQTAKTAAAKGSKILAQAGKAAVQAVWAGLRAVGAWLLAAIGPWGIAIIAITLVVSIGLVFIWPENTASDIQTVDMSKPGMVDAIQRLAALAGDPTALAQKINEETNDTLHILERVRVDIENAPLKKDIEEELVKAETTLNDLRSGGKSRTTQEQSALVGKLTYSMQRIIALYRGMSIIAPSEISRAALQQIGGNWVYSVNEKGSSTKVVRDGTNVVNGQRGCDSGGFISYILRGDNSRCAQCITPVLTDLAVTLPLFNVTKVTESNANLAYQIGDIVAMSTADSKALGGYVVTQIGNESGSVATELVFCGNNGPEKQTLAQVSAEKHQPILLFRLKTASP